jgi:hypothetical protein
MKLEGFHAPLSTALPQYTDLQIDLLREATGDPDRPFKFFRRPGLLARVGDFDGPIRGGVEVNGTVYVVTPRKCYAIDTVQWTSTELGEVAFDMRPSTVITNGTQVACVSGGYVYVHEIGSSTIAQVTDADLPAGVLGLVYTDLYAVAWFEGLPRIQLCAIDDFTSWASSDVAARSQYVDPIVTLIADQKDLVLIGEKTNETWFHSGNASFPFEPVPNALSRQGSAAVYGGCLVGDTPYFLGRSDDGDGIVFRMRGYTPQRVSNAYVERRLAALDSISDAVAFSLLIEGHRLFVLTFLNSACTLVFDESLPPEVAWGEWSFWDRYTATREAFRGRCHIFAGGRHLIGSRREGALFEMSSDYLSDQGEPIVGQRRWRGPRGEGKQVFIREARLHAQTGVGTASVPDPKVLLRLSRDGGMTWTDEMPKPVGRVGEYARQAIWRGLGAGADPAWDLTMADAVPLVWHDFSVDATAGAH